MPDTAIDPVCGMTVEKTKAPATTEYKGSTFYFCSSECKGKFVKDPARYIKEPVARS